MASNILRTILEKRVVTVDFLETFSLISFLFYLRNESLKGSKSTNKAIFIFRSHGMYHPGPTDFMSTSVLKEQRTKSKFIFKSQS